MRYFIVIFMFLTLAFACGPTGDNTTDTAGCSDNSFNELEPNNGVASADTLGIPTDTTCSSVVSADAVAGDKDFFQFNTGTFTSIDINLSGCGIGSAVIQITDSAGIVLAAYSTSGGTDFLNANWPIDAQNLTRYININSISCAVPYTLTVTGN
ncbi:MAG: hypothetical protein OEZ36_03915 [Spirochaetota bacterium]|nr:hypothetical protein [Spirochaetota bacterium]